MNEYKNSKDMPKKLERCVADVMRTGKSESSAYAICQSSLNKAKKANPKPKR